MDTTKKVVWVCFTGHEYTDGFEIIMKTQKNHKTRESFFITGDFCKTHGNEKIISRLMADGHYIGPHSDMHLLYCSMKKSDSISSYLENRNYSFNSFFEIN